LSKGEDGSEEGSKLKLASSKRNETKRNVTAQHNNSGAQAQAGTRREEMRARRELFLPVHADTMIPKPLTSTLHPRERVLQPENRARW
jgi:hypothetical protein